MVYTNPLDMRFMSSIHKWAVLPICLGLMWGLGQGCAEPAASAPHVFLIMVDDLKPALGCYGNKFIQTPYIDALAADALLFENAYANVPVCGASRASLFSGLRPSRNRFKNYASRISVDAPGVQTLPAFFRANGYLALSMGKTFHHPDDQADDWSSPPFRGTKKNSKDYILPTHIEAAAIHPRKRAASFERVDTTDLAYLDGRLANYALDQVDAWQEKDTALFFAIGFWKPHLPWNAPSRYWELYERDKLPFPDNYATPMGVPAAALHNFGELRSYTDVPDDDRPFDSAMVRQHIHGYYASLSYVDAQIGRFIEGLKERGMYEESLIVLAGDHGWFLGEHQLWSKHANFREALRTALMIKFPGNARKGASSLLVELVELYPSLADILQLSPPGHLEAASFLPALEDEKRASQKAVYCRFNDGETIISGFYAYTEFVNDSGHVYDRMLFDHQHDPAENENLAGTVELALLDSLSHKLAHYRETYDD